jgi:shikimate dehydrogenase
LVLGSGATARSVVAALAARGCRKVTFAVRSVARQETLDQAGRAGLEVDVAGLGQLASALVDAQLVISTLPANALGDALDAVELSHGSLQADHLFLDVVYTGWPTPLARRFQAAGARAVSGLEMLVHQAAEQVHLMTGLRPPVEAMRAAGQDALAGLSGRSGLAQR